MTGVDDEFEDFLKRRKPKFRAPDDMFEPPAELDRVVLRQAREAIESERPLKVFHGPRWAAPVALAATMLLAVTIIFQVSAPSKQAPVPEVTVQNIAERVEVSEAAAPMASAATNNQARDDAAAGARLHAATVIDETVVCKREQERAEFRPGLVTRAIHDDAAPDFLEKIVGDIAVARLAREVAIESASMA